ncbi:MAG: acyl-CoA dehydrogenase family protein [Acidimicrobiia bacterium]|nr:acyl-CoA dehydrogenase family protein [Acidimicrobiia bacterium]
MDFELSDDQEALRERGTRPLAGHADPGRVRAVVDAGGGTDRELWAAMADQGWTGLTVPDDLGGLGLGTVEAAVLLEEVGRHLAPAPVLQHLVATHLLAPRGHGGGASAPCPALAAGEAVGTVVRMGADVDAAPGPPTSGRMRRHAGSAGTPEPVVHGPSADLAPVRAYDVEGRAAGGAVPGGAPGRRVRSPSPPWTAPASWAGCTSTTPPPSRCQARGPGLVQSVSGASPPRRPGRSLLRPPAPPALDLSVACAKEREPFKVVRSGGFPGGGEAPLLPTCWWTSRRHAIGRLPAAAWAIGPRGDPRASAWPRRAAAGVVLRRGDARARLRPPVARGHRLHLGGRHAPPPQAGPARSGDLRGRQRSFDRSRLARSRVDRVAAGEPVI